MTKLDLLVVNYNTQDKLERLLRTLTHDYEEGIFKLYIADNDSSDNSIDWLKSHSSDYPIERVFYNENIGYGGAINQMAAASDSELLAAVNADTWFTTNHVKEAIQTFADNPSQGVMGPKQIDERHRIRHGGITQELPEGADAHSSDTYFNVFCMDLKHRGWALIDESDSRLNDRLLCPSVSGSLYYTRRELWDQIKSHPKHKEAWGPDVNAFGGFHHYYEETLYSYVSRYLGWEVWYDGEIETAGHSWAASTGPQDPILRKYFLDSRKKFIDACETWEITLV